VLAGGRAVARSKYRPDSWGTAEWVVVASGIAAVVGVVLAGKLYAGSLTTSTYPIVAPALPWPAAAGIVLALLPAWLPTVAVSRPRKSAPAEERQLVGAAR
jgi:energy-coupling factor transport system permease protein